MLGKLTINGAILLQNRMPEKIKGIPITHLTKKTLNISDVKTELAGKEYRLVVLNLGIKNNISFMVEESEKNDIYEELESGCVSIW
jgi:hypothetical protein